MKIFFYIFILTVLRVSSAWADTQLSVKKVSADFSKLEISGAFWKEALEQEIVLVAQPMISPRPQKTMTEKIYIKALHNGEWVAFLLRWKDQELSDAPKLGKFSDAVALQFPVKSNETPPPIFMGSKDQPVHILHWRAQYQKDKKNPKMETYV